MTVFVVSSSLRTTYYIYMKLTLCDHNTQLIHDLSHATSKKTSCHNICKGDDELLTLSKDNKEPDQQKRNHVQKNAPFHVWSSTPNDLWTSQKPALIYESYLGSQAWKESNNSLSAAGCWSAAAWCSARPKRACTARAMQRRDPVWPPSSPAAADRPISVGKLAN
jgi:hypothetical protein